MSCIYYYLLMYIHIFAYIYCLQLAFLLMHEKGCYEPLHGEFDFFLNLYNCAYNMGVVVLNLYVVMTLLTKIQSSIFLLKIHACGTQFKYRWCHLSGAYGLSRGILGQYQITCIVSSKQAMQFNARTLPT